MLAKRLHKTLSRELYKIIVNKHIKLRAPQCFGRHVNPLVPATLQSLAPTNPHWARVVGYGPFFLCVLHKEALCPSSGEIKMLMMMMMINPLTPMGCYNATEKNLTTTLILVTKVRYNAIIFPAFPDEQIFFQYFSEVGALHNMSKNHNNLSSKIVSGVSELNTLLIFT
jgi:hypothetical protein